MAAKDLMFKIAIFDETKDSLKSIKDNLSSLQQDAYKVSTSLTSITRALGALGQDANLSNFTRELKELQSVSDKKMNAFDVTSLKSALKNIESIADTMGGNKLTSSFKKATESMDSAIGYVGKTTQDTLYAYRMRVEKAFNGISEIWKTTVQKINKDGGLELFPSARGNALAANVKILKSAYEQLQNASAGFLGSINRSLGVTEQIQLIIDKVRELQNAVSATHRMMIDNGFFGKTTEKAVNDVASIISKVGELQNMLKTFGNGQYGDVMRGFVSAVDNAVKQVSEKLRGLNEIKLNIGGANGGSPAATQQTEAVNSTTEAYEKQKVAVSQLARDVSLLQNQYNKALAASKKFAGQDLERVLLKSDNDVRTARYQLSKQLESVFGGAFKNVNFDFLSNSYSGINSAKEMYDQYMKAIASRSKAGKDAALSNISTAAVFETFRGDGTNEILGFFKKLSEGAKKNSQDYKVAQYALEQYAAAAKAAKSPHFEGVRAYYKDLQNAVSNDRNTFSDINAAKDIKNREKALNKAKEELQKEQEILDKMKSLGSTSKNGKELTLNFKEDDFVAPLEKAQQRIRAIIEQIGKDVSGGLKDALNTDISSTKTIQQLGELANGLNGLESKLQGASKVAQQLQQVKEQADNIKANLTSAATGGSMATGNNEDKFTANINQLVRNQDTIDLLATKLKKAKQDADSARERITKNGGDTADIDKYTAKLENLINILGQVRNQYSLLNGNKGMMMIPQNGAIKDLAEFVTSLTNKNYSTPAELMAAVKELTTPSGAVSRTLMAEANSFTAYARQLEAAARARETTMSNLERRRILSDSLVDITKGSDIRSALARFNTITSAQEGVAYNQSSLKKSIEDIVAFKNKIDALSEAELNQKGKVANLQAEYNKLTNIYRKHLSQYNQLLAAYEKSNNTGVKLDTASLSMAENKIASLTFALKEYKNTIDAASKLNLTDAQKVDLDALTQAYNTLTDAVKQFKNIRDNALNGRGAKTDEGLTTKDVLSKYSVGSNEIYGRNYNREFKKEIKASQGSVTELKAEALQAYSAINNQIQKMDKAMRDGLKFNVDTTNLETAMNAMRQYQEQLRKIAEAGGNLQGLTAKMVTSDAGYMSAKSNAVLETNAVNANVSAKREAEAQNKALASSENLVAQAISQSTGAAHNQSQVLSDLKSMAAQYLSIWGAQQFIEDMANITGELELQRKSLEVILGSGSAAAEMYSQLRDLSQQSPYTFEDLLKAHRQLAAFGIDAKNIYGTMKSLTDIGAGLDVPVERLILAYGHTKSYGYLSGIQNRQFETAGIDLVGALTKHYNDLADAEEKAGKAATHVTRADIFKRMRSRDIPFEDVEKVIMDLDKPGGKFYNMQIRQYDTLGGKLRNLRNNYHIMLSEMGESTHGILSFFVNGFNSATENWAKLATVLKGVLIPLGAIKLAMIAINKAGATSVNSIANSTHAKLRQQTAVLADRPTNFWSGLRYGYGPNLNKLNTSNFSPNAFGTQLKSQLDNGALTKNMAAQLAYSSKLPYEFRRVAASAAGMGDAEAAAAAKTTGLTRSIHLLGLRTTSVGSSIGNFARGMVTAIWNPATAVMMIATTAMSVFEWFKKEAATVNRISEEMRSNSARDLETIDSTLDELEDKYGKFVHQGDNNRDVTHTSQTATKSGKPSDDTTETMPIFNRNGWRFELDEAKMAVDGIDNIMEDLDKKMQVLDPLYKGDLFDTKKFESQYAQASDMAQKLAEIEYAKRVEENNPSPLADANKRSHNIFTDSYANDIKDLQDARQKAENALMSLTSSDINGFLNDKRTNMTYSQDTRNFIKNFEKDNADLNKAGMEREKIKRMFEQGALRKVGMSPGSNKVNLYIEALGSVESAKEEIQKSIPEIAETMENAYTSAFKGRPMAFSYYLRDNFNALMSEFKVSDPSVIEEQYLQLYNTIASDLASKGDSAGLKEFQRVFASSIMGEEVENEIKKNLQENFNGKELSQLTKPQLQKLVDESVKTVRDRLMQKFPALKKIIASLFGINSNETKSALNNIRNEMMDFTEAWKREANAKLGNTLFGPLIKSAKEFTEWIDAANKQAKQFADDISKLKPYLKIHFGFDFASSKTMLAYFKRYKAPNGKQVDLSKSLNELPQYIKTPTGAVVDTSTVKKLYDELVAMEDIEKYNKANGTSIGHDTKKEKSAADKAKREREKAANEADRRLIKNLQERQRALSKAFSDYWEWYEKLGKDNKATIEKVKKNLKESGIVFPSDYNINSINGVDSINNILNKEKAYVKQRSKALHNKKDNEGSINSILSSLQSDIDRNEQKKFDDNTKKYTSELDLQLKTLEKQYDIYKKIYELTGNRNMALQLSGRQKSTDESYQSKADDMRDAIQANVTKALQSMKLKGVTDMDIDFGKVLSLDDDNITRYVGQLFNETDNGDLIKNNQALQEMIAGVVEKLKEWRDTQRQINEESITNTAEVLGSMKDYASLLDKLKAKYGNIKADINRPSIRPNGNSQIVLSNGSTGSVIKSIGETVVDSGFLIPKNVREKAETANRANYNYEAFKLTPEFRALIEKSIAAPMDEIKTTALKAIRLLTDKLLAGTISPEEYQKERDNIIGSVSSIYSNKPMGSFFSFLNGGMTQVYKDRSSMEGSEAMNYYLEADRQKKNALEAQAKIDRYNNDMNEAVKSGDLNGISRAANNLIGANIEKNNAITAFKEAFGKGKNKEDKSDKDKEKADKNEKLNKQIDAVIKGMQGLQSAFSLLSNTFDALGLGDTGAGQALSDASDVMGGMLSGASSLSAFGPYGMAAGAALGLVGSLAGVHDKHQQKKIDQLSEDVSKIEGYTETIAKAQERTLGYDYGDVIRGYQKMYQNNVTTLRFLGRSFTVSNEGAAGKAMASYYGSAGADTDLNGYQQQYNMLIQKRKDYVGMYNAENGKKKKNNQSLEEYKQKIAELDDEIRYFAQDLAKTLWDIDIKSWADQISDALMSAFENGENAAKAFNDTVRSILQGVFSKMLKLQVLEPMFQNLQDKLFGNSEKGIVGVMDVSDIVGSSQRVAQVIADYFGTNGEGRKAITAAQQFYNGVNLGLSNAGLTLDNDSSSTLSSGISSASEDSINALSGYVASLRQDVAVIRLQDTMFYNESWPDYVKQITESATHLKNIDTNVQAIRSIISENGALYEQVRTLRNDLHDIVTQRKAVKME